MPLMTSPITDGTIRVRRLERRDAAAFVAGTRDRQVRRFAHLPVAEYTEELFLEQLDTVIAAGLRGQHLAVLAIADAASDEFLGSITLFDVDNERATAEIGFWTRPAARGRGAAARAVELLAGWAVELGLRELTARTDIANEASGAVLERAGFTRVDGPREQTAPDGQSFRGLGYARRLVPEPTGACAGAPTPPVG